MTDDNKILKPEDYQEPRCVVCMDNKEPNVTPIPQDRVIFKLNEYFDKNDYEGAERHLKFWLTEAKFGNDVRGEMIVHNEMMGLYRKTNKKDEAYLHMNEALKMMESLGMKDNLSGCTIQVNAATVCEAFKDYDRSLELFNQAKPVYEQYLKEDDFKLGSLYNNMGLCLVSLKRYGEAYEIYNKALNVMMKNKNGKLEQAMTYLNMANAVEDEHGLEKSEEKINQYLDIALNLINDESVERNGYYAFVCEKCAPTFDYYGYFMDAADLKERAKAIYERS